MTVIAFDGKTVAADRLAANHHRKDATTKIFRHGRKVLAFNGDAAAGMALVAWYKSGAPAEHFPNKGLGKDDTAWLTVFEAGKHVQEYQMHPVPIIVESLPYACGSGCMSALGAMYAGAPPREAVEITAMVDCSTGMGVDVMELETSERGGA